MDKAPFNPIRVRAGRSTASQQLFYGLDSRLPRWPNSSISFDPVYRQISFELFCPASSESRASLWPLRGDIPWEDILTRGIRLDPILPQHNLRKEDQLLPQPYGFQLFTLRIDLRRPPKLWYTYPGERGPRQPKWTRRAVEEDYIELQEGKKGMEDEPVSVLGLGMERAFFKVCARQARTIPQKEAHPV